jgi:hypothetical protein
MTRSAVRSLATVGVLAVTLATPTVTRAAGDVVVSVSPRTAVVGQPVEVLVRTFRVVERSDLSLPFETPTQPYPVPSGVWNILYTWEDYPFDVVALHQDGTEVPLTLARDPSDATVWRGVVSLPKAGMWTVWVRNFQDKGAGSTAAVAVTSGPAPSQDTRSGYPTAAPALEAGPAALIGALLGVFAGVGIGRVWRMRRES